MLYSLISLDRSATRFACEFPAASATDDQVPEDFFEAILFEVTNAAIEQQGSVWGQNL